MAFSDVQVIATRLSDNETFEYNTWPWKIPHDGLDGIDDPAVEVYSSSKGFGNGDILTGMRLMSREITIKTICQLQGSKTAAKRHTARMFHRFMPTLTTIEDPIKYDIAFTYKGRTVTAKNCILKSYSNPAKNIWQQETMTVVFLCLDPYMYDSDGDKVGGI